MAQKPLGRFAWYDLMTPDPEGARAFYCEVTGWGAEAWDGAAAPYTMWVNGEQSIGGVMQLPPEATAGGAPPHWLAYVSTPDLVATLDKARSLGGSVMMGPMEIPGVGTIAVIQDPQGAAIAAYEPSGEAPGHDEPARPGEFSWHELATDGWADAWSFYSELFGWQESGSVDMGEIGTYFMFGRGAHPLGGIFDRPPEMPVSAWLYYVRVPDMGAALARVEKGGGQVLNGPMEVPGGDHIAQCMDPQGGMFALHAAAQG